MYGFPSARHLRRMSARLHHNPLFSPGANLSLAMQTTEFETMLAYVETFFSQSGTHGLDHILRVTRLSEEIGRA